MRNTKVYSITMPPDLAKQAERLAKKENRTMSELMREALRRYQAEQYKKQLQDLNAYGRAKAKELGVREADVVAVIHQLRKEGRQKKLKQPAQ